MGNIWFTSDTHYSHKNIIRGVSEWSNKERTRDFNSIEELRFNFEKYFKMKTKLIQFENYLLLIEDVRSPNLSVGDYFICKDLSALGKILEETKVGFNAISLKNIELSFLYHQTNEISKILAHLPLKNSSTLEGVVFLPKFEEKNFKFKSI